MTIDSLKQELNPSQRAAVLHGGSHALVLAGAGCGKTKTIVARAAHLISTGVAPQRIQILTFTRRSAAEIVERVRLSIGDRSQGLRASTFHTWCAAMVRRAPKAFGFATFTPLDRDDQLVMFRVLRGRRPAKTFPSAAQLCEVYSYARNTLTRLDDALKKQMMEHYSKKDEIVLIMREYEERKRARNYFDYDDILDVVAQGISQYPELCRWLGSQYDHILVDEMQDTNPLQWKLLEPLASYATLFCVGDDAQSIYGFRGADFKNVHNFHERIPGSTVLKLEDNYRSTQEILDLSNWLLSRAAVRYDKKLRAVRGSGHVPRMETFANEWQEGRWIAEDLLRRRSEGACWNNHMILVRSSYAFRSIEQALLAREIPYRFIGGTTLLESAHVKDMMSVLRICANFRDEIGWMRFLTLWDGLGEATAARLVTDLLQHEGLNENLSYISQHPKVPALATAVLEAAASAAQQISKAIRVAVTMLTPILADKYRNQEWDKRQRDFEFVLKLSEKHTSILEFLEEYILEPVYNSALKREENSDVVDAMTIHQAKGTEKKVCYVANVSPGAYPGVFSVENVDDVEEERRVLYVALTRAVDELIVTRRSFNRWAHPNRKLLKSPGPAQELQNHGQDPREADPILESYFLNGLPESLIKESVHSKQAEDVLSEQMLQPRQIKFGIDLS